MTTNSATRLAAGEAAPRGPGGGSLAVVLLSGVALGAATTSSGFARFTVASSAVILIAVVCLRAPRQAVLALFVWLVALGTMRRILLVLFEDERNDPLVLVAPLVVAVLVLVAARRGAFRARSRLSGAVLFLTGLVLAGVLNPLQGGVAVGLGGLLFVLVPLLWFWVGRTVVDDGLLRRLLALIAVLAPLSALYGLYQVYRGFPPWDAEWVEARGFVSLQVGDALRQFASFSSASEYVIFLAMGMVIWALYLRRAGLAPLAVPILVLLGWAVALASVRGIIVGLVVTLGMLLAVARGMGLVRTIVLGLTGLVVLTAAASSIDPTAVGGKATSSLLARQVTGLSDPFNSDPDISTVPGHIQSAVDGLLQAVRNPIGRGTGSVSIAADKFGEGSSTTEVDPSNAAVAFGIPGLLAYGAVFFLGLRLAFRRARRQRDLLSMAALGILLMTSLQWLNGGNYAVAPLPWLVLGWLDRPSAPERHAPDEIEAVAAGR